MIKTALDVLSDLRASLAALKAFVDEATTSHPDDHMVRDRQALAGQYRTPRQAFAGWEELDDCCGVTHEHIDAVAVAVTVREGTP
jgi:hypothetical protein